jgi:hypothetical protein
MNNMNNKTKKKWNRPVIASTLSIKQTLGVIGTMGDDGGMGMVMYTS